MIVLAALASLVLLAPSQTALPTLNSEPANICTVFPEFPLCKVW